MKVLYLYMFPLWGNGSGAWLRRLTHHITIRHPESYQAAIVAPETRMLKKIKIFRLKPPIMGVFVGNPELPGVKKYSRFSNQEFIQLYNYYLLRTSKAIEKNNKMDNYYLYAARIDIAIANIIAKKDPRTLTDQEKSAISSYIQEAISLAKIISKCILI